LFRRERFPQLIAEAHQARLRVGALTQRRHADQHQGNNG
jgi:hypothetical protein